MVASEFLEELKLTRRDFDWEYRGAQRRLRGRLKSDPLGQLFDPIGAVCYSRTGKVFSETDWFRASEEIGLTHLDAGDATGAGNTMCRRSNQTHLKPLRHLMIEELQLEPEALEPTLTEIPGYLKGCVVDLLDEMRTPA
jgi:hypothetical protein